MRRAAPKPTIHQMCQIIAKPMTTAKNALMKPIGLFFGISIGSYSRAGVSLIWFRAACAASCSNRRLSR